MMRESGNYGVSSKFIYNCVFTLLISHNYASELQQHYIKYSYSQTPSIFTLSHQTVTFNQPLSMDHDLLTDCATYCARLGDCKLFTLYNDNCLILGYNFAEAIITITLQQDHAVYHKANGRFFLCKLIRYSFMT